MSEDLVKRLAHIVAASLDNPSLAETINEDSRLDEIGIQSLTFIKIMVSVEAEFGVEIADEELLMDNQSFSSMAAVVRFIQTKIDGNRGRSGEVV
ncbi:acyl carrier protein [Paenibacillus elgii]